VASYKESQATTARQMLAGSGVNADVFVGRTPEIIAACTACMAVSGSVGLELLVRSAPTVVVYRMSKGLHWLGRRLSKVKDISLVNLLAGERIFPEFAVSWDASADIAAEVLKLLNDPSAVVRKLEALKAKVAVPGAVERAADFLAGELTRKTATTS
jgi:lipid-A-disaccharide synthase